MRPVIRFSIVAALAAVTLPLVAAAQAPAYPSKPIRMLIPYPPGGSSDILARMIGPKLTEAWGQPVVVENRLGAGGNIAMEATARAPADGYTFVLTDVGNVAISPSVYTKLPFDILRDLTPISMVSYSPHMLATHPNVPAKTVAELIALARKNPGKLNVPVGLGSAVHLAALALEQKAGTKWLYVPTKGGQASILTLATGEGDFLMMGMLQTLPHARSGRIKAIAVSSEKREPTLPNVPTMQETPGLEGFVTGSYQGIMAPPKMPADIVAKMNGEIKRVQGLPDIREKLLAQSTVTMPMTSLEMGKWLASEKDRWAAVIKTSGFKIE